MAKKEKYRLTPLLRVKERQRRKAEENLARALKELSEEKRKLARLEDLKKELKEKREKTRLDMANRVAGGQSRVRESQFHLGFLTRLKEDEEKLDGEIKEQKEALTQAEQKVKRARRDYVDAAQELNVMEKHRELWNKKQARTLSALEAKQMNELGNTLFQTNKMRAG
ncbi:MAG: hypothetical protein Q7T11_00230 [Deltaproteobacteria bacterium]|nr:hypothetical protein [Deltaproteobacteria bacterium]